MKMWKESQKEFDDVCKELNSLLLKNFNPHLPEVQQVIARHYAWIKNFWVPTKESYCGLGLGYTAPEWKATFESYDPQLASYLAAAMNIFADHNL